VGFLSSDNSSAVEKFGESLNSARNYSEVWRIVKETVLFSLEKGSRSMMLFLDDLPIQLGAYHPIGTNNIVLNRTLVEIVETTINTKPVVNALIYNLLLHEYLHALGEYSEVEVRRLVVVVAEKCFGEKHEVTRIARKTPWVLLGEIPLKAINSPKRVMQIVKDFEATDKYIV
jgi:hypothetical protein